MNHGGSKTRLYKVWSSMKSRCYNENDLNYKHYGARGIKICDEWRNDFVAFQIWSMAMGYDESAPRGQYTIERIDYNGPYSPDNCRWATMKEQENNKRNNILVVAGGEEKTLKQWCDETGRNYANELKSHQRREAGKVPRAEYLERAKENRDAIRQAIKENPGMSIRMLASKTGFSKSAVHREKFSMDIDG